MPSIPSGGLPSRRRVLQWTALAAVAGVGCASSARYCVDHAAGLARDEVRLLSSAGEALAIVQRNEAGGAVLRARARPLGPGDPLAVLERRMRATLEASGRGVGLAAPQVGLRARAVLAKLGARGEHPQVLFFVNPAIVERSDEVTLDYEGCLSIAGVCGLVRRNRRVRVEHGLPGRRAVLEAAGFDARIFQHELDHLDGVLYLDRVEGGLQPRERLDELRQQLRREHPDLAQATPSGRRAREALL